MDASEYRFLCGFLDEHGAAHRRRFEWSPSFRERRMVESRYWSDEEGANAEVRQKALLSGYVPPRWWEFWRWREASLP